MGTGTGRVHIEAAIAAIDGQRATLGDAATDLALAPLREQLATLPPAPSDDAETPRLKQVTILFVDLVDSTAIANRLDPEEVDELMDEILRRFTAVAEQFRARVFNYTGDGLLAVFGADEAREDDAELAVRAGLAVLDEARAVTVDVVDRFPTVAIEVRVGIDTGRVLLGGSVEGQRNIRGNAVNVAARMEQSAPVGGLRISEDTYRLVRGAFDVTEEPPIVVKGIPEPVRTYLVHRAKPRAFRVAARGIEGVETEMVGRDDELASLRRAFAASYTDPGLRSVTVVADPGLGKSRLLYEFENWAEVQPESYVIFKGRAQPRTRQEPFGLLRDLFAWRYQIADGDPAEVARERLLDGLRPLFVDSGEAPIHLLGHVLGFDFGDSEWVRGITSDPQQIRRRALAAAAQVFARIDAADPVVMLVEDLHWADDDSLDFLTYLARSHPSLRMLVVASARPLLIERRPDWLADTAPNERLDLLPLDPSQTSALARALLTKMEEPSAVLLEALTARGDGNPYFMEEIVKMLLDEGALVPTGVDSWTVEPDRLAALRVPSTLVGVLQARLDALASEERTTLQQASVIGYLFWDRAVAALEGRPPRALGPLTRRGFVRPQLDSSIAGSSEFTFEHHLLQQFTYDSILKRDRREYHALAARWLAELADHRGTEFLGATGEHFERAGQPKEALDYYTRAAETAAGRDSRTTALEYVTRAVALCEPDDVETRWRLAITQESIVAIGSDPGAHDAVLDNLTSIAEALDDDARRADVALRRTNALLDRGDHRGGEVEGLRAIELAERADAPHVAARAHGQLSRSARRTNRLLDAQHHASVGLAVAAELDDPRVEAHLLAALTTVCADNGDIISERDLGQRALELAQAIGDRLLEANLHNTQAATAFKFGELDAALASWTTALALSRELEWTYGECIVLLNLAGHGTATGAYNEAVECAEAAIALAVASDLRDLEAAASLHLGIARTRLDQGALARRALMHSRDLFLLNDGEHYALDPLAALAVLDLAEGDDAAALAKVEQVLAFVADGGELAAIEEPFRVRLECFIVLDHLDDARAVAILDESAETLSAHAARLPEADRARFLHANPYQHSLLEAYQAARGG